jgi:hypothetical protein
MTTSWGHIMKSKAQPETGVHFIETLNPKMRPQGFPRKVRGLSAKTGRWALAAAEGPRRKAKTRDLLEHSPS